MVLERRTRIVAKVVSNYLKKHDLRFDKAIFFCVDTEHADRMWQALINENQDLVNQDERYIMRITGDDPIGKKQLKNFQDVSSRCPTLVTTSKLLTTGVDAQMVRFIVLDSNINSMTEFNQIISRDTRVRDGPSKQDQSFTPDVEGNIPDFDSDPVDIPSDNTDENNPTDFTDEPPSERRVKHYVHDVEVTVLKQRVQYIDKDGKLITESLTDYTRRNVRNQYATLDDFLTAWSSANRKQAILDELAAQGVLIEELQEQIGPEFDPFDLLCHVAFDMPPLTRRERANNVKKRNYFAKYGKQAQAVLNALLDKYADTGVTNLENMDVLKIRPISDFGNPAYIVNRIFKGKKVFEQALRKLEEALYAT